MCGITGVFVFDREGNLERNRLEQMNQQIVHRGPDDAGVSMFGNVGLAMRRLSIIDLSTGHQPLSNEDGSAWIVFNGEIYNYRELRESLEAQGHRFQTHSDTETIIHTYDQYGRDCVNHLRGMFAFAIWDKSRRRLLIARDRLGIKPLYYCRTDSALIFGSEIKCLLEYPGVPRRLNRAALSEYLAFGYLSGEQTLYSGIFKLSPGHTMEVGEEGRVDIRRYWDLEPDSQQSRSTADYIGGYRALLEQCVNSHLMSDVPLGVFLSGGIDSSVVAAMAARAHSEPIRTFSVGYSESLYSELPYAEQMANHIGSIHSEVRVSRQQFFAALPQLIWHEDEPIVWPSSVALYFVARLAGEQVKVVLTGEGSDETLGGYSRYALTLWNSKFQAVYRRLAPSALRSATADWILTSPLLHANLRRRLEHTFLGRDGDSWNSLYFENFLCAFSVAEQRDLLAPSALEESDDPFANALQYWNQSSGDLLSRMLYTDIKTYLVELLMKQDQMSMAASIESRVPFLDHVLVEYAAGIPTELKVRGLTGKHILKNAVRDLLPAQIIDRVKMGFPTPFHGWLKGPSLPWVEGLLTEPRTLARGLFQPASVKRLVHEHKTGQRDHTDRLWRLLNLELWHRTCIERDEMGGASRIETRPMEERSFIGPC